MNTSISNFGRNIEFQPTSIFRPETVNELLQILDKHHGQEIRAVGSLHSWSQAAVTSGITLELKNLNSIDVVSEGESHWVQVGGGCKLKHLIQQLAVHGLTLPSLGVIVEQTIAGATATGTHGSGKNSLSHYIEEVTIAHYDGESGKAIITVVNSGPELEAARCSLGLLGIVVSVKLRCRQLYSIEEHALGYDDLKSVLAKESELPLQQFYLLPWSWRYLAHHRRETKAPRSLSALFYRMYRVSVIDIGLHIAIYTLAKLIRLNWLTRFFYNWILPAAVIRNWRVVDDSTSMLTMNHDQFRHIEIELFVQRSMLDEATQFLIDVTSMVGGKEMQQSPLTREYLSNINRWDDLQALKGTYCHHYPITFRRVQVDSTLISMASPGAQADEDWYAISLISYQWPSDRKGFFSFAEFVATTMGQLFGARCHWGKHNPLERAQIESLYPNLEKFRAIASRFDPNGVFKNNWFRELI